MFLIDNLNVMACIVTFSTRGVPLVSHLYFSQGKSFDWFLCLEHLTNTSCVDVLDRQSTCDGLRCYLFDLPVSRRYLVCISAGVGCLIGFCVSNILLILPV